MPKALTRIVTIPASANPQTILLPGVFTDAAGVMNLTTVDVLKLPDAGPLWIAFLTGPATPGAADVSLCPDGTPLTSFHIGHLAFRQAHRATRPDLQLSVCYPNVTGDVQFTFH